MLQQPAGIHRCPDWVLFNTKAVTGLKTNDSQPQLHNWSMLTLVGPNTQAGLAILFPSALSEGWFCSTHFFIFKLTIIFPHSLVMHEFICFHYSIFNLCCHCKVITDLSLWIYFNPVEKPGQFLYTNHITVMSKVKKILGWLFYPKQGVH